MRKPDFCICQNKDADQLRGNRETDQRLCFCYTDSTIPLLSISEIPASSLLLWLWPKAEGNSASGHPQHRGGDSFDCCTERYEIVVLLPNSEDTHTVYPVTPNAGMFYQRGYKQ